MTSKQLSYILIIILSQFFCTSLWFAGNAVMTDLISTFSFSQNALATLTSVVQFGFITGTLAFALLALADRFPATKLFAICGLLASIANFSVTFLEHTPDSKNTIVVLRFFVGFFLAGIYPVGMKIASDHFQKGLGKALGFLVGALVLGTALPHLIKGLGSSLKWEETLGLTSVLAITGSALMYFFVPDVKNKNTIKKIDFSLIFKIFKNKPLKHSAFGYFGHMFELYTFWAFVPLMIKMYLESHNQENWSVSWISFIVIASGCISCAISGFVSERITVTKFAFMSLSLSGICCLISPLAFLLPPVFFFLFLIIWGMAVISDSPMFSTLVAQNADSENKGTALTLVNSIGFGITILSIQLVDYFINNLHLNTNSFLILAVGPLFGLYFTYKKQRNSFSK